MNDARGLRNVILTKDERAWGPHPRRSSIETVQCYSSVSILTAGKLSKMLGARISPPGIQLSQ